MKTINIFLLVIGVLLVLAKHAFAQVEANGDKTGIDTVNVKVWYPKTCFSERDTMQLDTSLLNFQRYDARSRDYDMAASTMNIGSPLKDLYFGILPTQFSVAEHALGTYFYKTENMPRYKNVKIPYSEIFYTMAGYEENYLRGTVGNQASDRLYLGLNFNVESTFGLFANQQLRNAHFQGLISFETTDKRYGYDFEYIHNKFYLGENGGLKYDSEYEDSTSLDRQVLDVNLEEASNTVKSHFFAFNQHFNIGKAATDSTKHNFLGKVYLNTSFGKQARMYEDYLWDESYYKNAYIDSVSSYDSVSCTDFKIDFGISNFYPERHQYLSFDMGVAVNNKRYFDGREEYYFNYLIPHADVILDFHKIILVSGFKYQLKIPGKNTFDFGANDFNFYGNAKFPVVKNFMLDAGIKMNLVSPHIGAYSLYSNHFIWSNTYDKQKHVELNGHINYKGYDVEASVHNLTDYTYFNHDALPSQYRGNIQVISAKFKKRYMFKKAGSSIMLMYQKSSNEDILRLPDFVARGSFFVSWPMFKKALVVHPGLDIAYITSYYGDTYSPAIMQFHIQDDKELDNHIYIDAYVNFKIKRARVFLKYQNLGSHLGTYNYFLVAHYPQPDGIFKIGFSWKFFD